MATATTLSTLEWARKYVDAGLSVIPIGLGGSKLPFFSMLPTEWDDKDAKYKATWGPFAGENGRRPTDEELVKWFGKSEVAGIGVVCGASSLNAQCIDIDDEPTGQDFFNAVKEANFPLFDELIWVQTPSMGLHCWFRCEEIEGSKKLAWPEKIPGQPCEALAETRGTNAYAVAPGSPVKVHKTGQPYEYIFERDLSAIPNITVKDRVFLLQLAKSYDRSQVPEVADIPEIRGPKEASHDGEISPCDAFDKDGSWEDLIKKAGGKLVSGTWEDGKIRRPGKDESYSATIGHCRSKLGLPLLRVFSSSWAPLELGRAYGKSQFYRVYFCDGDGKRAMRELREKGYGSPRPIPQPKTQASSHANGHSNGHGNGHSKSQASSQAVPQAAQAPQVQEWLPHINLTETVETEPFPLDVFPAPLVKLIREIAESMGNCATDYPGVFALGVLAGTIGGRFNLLIKDGYEEITNLYLSLIGCPGDGKSPSCKPLKKPLSELQSQRRRDDGKKALPVFLDDITMAALAPEMVKQPLGVLILRDELSGWILSMDQFKAGGKGDDKQRWLSINSGDSIQVNRVTGDDNSIFIPHPRVTVVGGIQPDVLDSLRGSRTNKKDGFYDRILFAFPVDRGFVKETWKTPSRESIEAWADALEAIRKADCAKTSDGRDMPHLITLAPCGRLAWEEWTQWVADTWKSENFMPTLRGPLAKLQGFVGRFALILHVADMAFYGSFNTSEKITVSTILRARKLGEYFLKHAEKVYRASGRDERIPPAEAVLKWIVRHGQPTLRRSDLWASLRRNSYFSRAEDLAPALKLLTIHRIIRWGDNTNNHSVGRPTTDLYEVNPSVFAEK